MKKIVCVLISAVFSLCVSISVLAQGDAAAGQAKATLCASCHGQDGNSALAMNPKLAGQNAGYLSKQLRDFKSGARPSPTMSAMVASLSDTDIADISAWYASQEITIGAAQNEGIELAQTIYRAGIKDLAVAACSACHSPTGQGNAQAGFAAIGGQHAEYTLLQLKAFRSGERANDASGMMRTITERLTDPELEALSNYLSGLN
ncbi:MAG: cytochrome c4 [SAR86 cluster bacterium]|uniref:Cytochrome c4 n=1 Tax=SAR86 cluster bacterium TaxID=2030880 RepID=A0A2A4MUN0_9GAMM|nr:MAG: cytochrome c4 [SAR86 cluster bacterium]